jgi:DNA-binding NarL/FixJ family response regulator
MKTTDVRGSMNNKKPVMIYFRSPNDNDVTKGNSTVVQEYNQVLPVDTLVCDSWAQLTKMLLDNPNQISINSNVFTNTDDTSIRETIGMLQTKLKLIDLDIPIALVVQNNTPRHVALEAKKLGLQGLVAYHGDWDSVVTMNSLQALTDRIIHWPEHIINQLPEVEQKSISVYFRKGWREYFQAHNEQEVLDRLAVSPELPWETKMCDDWDELGEILKLKPHQLIFHTSMLEMNGATVHEFVSMIRTLTKLTGTQGIPISISIEKTTPLSLIKEFQKAEIHGIVPSVSSFGIDETHKGIEALFNRIPYWPKHILDQLPGAKKTVTRNTITITPRQAQIADLILGRGLSNKRIAQALNITESTVKIHVSAILKAYGVRTRTQLVVSAQK